jgi:GT2 family glycosyltransferase
VALAIPCFDGAPTLGMVLEAVARLDPAPAEVLVVDDGSSDETATVAGRAGVRVVRHARNRGLAAARNTALRETRAPILTFLDDDCVPAPELLSVLLPAVTAEGVGGVGGCEGSIGEGATGWDRWRAAFRPQTHGPEPLDEVWMLPGLCCAYRREALEAVGGFDERFRTNGEDVDVGLRLRAAGWRLRYRPAAGVTHLRRDGFCSLLALCYRYNYWGALALRRNGESAAHLLRGQLRWTAVSVGSSLKRLRSPVLAGASVLLGLAGLAGTLAGLAAPKGG